MANTKSAKKRIRQSALAQARNRAARTRMRSAVRRLRQAIDAGERQQAEALLPETLRLVDATAQKKVVHGNAAARTKARLTRAVRALAR